MKLEALADLAGDTSIQSSIKARILVIVKDLLKKITLPVLSMGQVLVEDSNMGVLLMKKFLRAAYDEGIPTYVDFA